MYLQFTDFRNFPNHTIIASIFLHQTSIDRILKTNMDNDIIESNVNSQL